MTTTYVINNPEQHSLNTLTLQEAEKFNTYLLVATNEIVVKVSMHVDSEDEILCLMVDSENKFRDKYLSKDTIVVKTNSYLSVNFEPSIVVKGDN